MLVVILYHNYATLSIRLYASDKKYSSVIIHTSPVVVSAADSAVESHNSSYCSVNLFCGLFLISLDVTGGVGANVNIVHVPPQNRVTAVGLFSVQAPVSSAPLSAGDISLNPLSERHYCEAHALPGSAPSEPPQRSKAISRILKRSPSFSMNFSIKP